MNDYKDLIARLRSMDGQGDIQFNELINRKTGPEAADVMAALVSRVAELESRLEISPLHNVDGIMARDATIKLQDERIAELEAEREKQEPVAWYCDGEDGREYNGIPQMSNGRTGTPLYAAPPVITQHEPVTTVEDRYNADGKSRHITDDLPAGMPLYAAPVRPNDSELEMIARSHGTGGWQTLGDMVTFARAIESAVLRANGFKLEGEQ